jgi:uncharacterized protein YjiK
LCCRGKAKAPGNKDKGTAEAGYLFQQPDAKWELPSSLNEISGIGLLNDSIMVCQEDENGTLYLYNLFTNQVDKTISFGKQNDYEDLAIVGDDVYVLQSNGNIVQVVNYLASPVVSKFKTILSGKNDTEGICYDPVSKTLLVSCKDKQDLGEAASPAKSIFAFNLAEKKIADKAFLSFDEPEFAPTALAVHPFSHNIFVLSSKKRRLIELTRAGVLVNRYELKGSIFKQPEGLTIAGNGDVYISNEGDGGTANILLFKPKR